MELRKYFTVYPKLMHEIFNDYTPAKELAGLNKTQITTLVILLSNPNCHMSLISKHLNLKKGSFTTVTEALVNMGLVNKERDKSDKRSYKLVLTELGRNAAEKHMNDAQEHLEKKFCKIDKSYYERFIKALSELYDISQELKENK